MVARSPGRAELGPRELGWIGLAVSLLAALAAAPRAAGPDRRTAWLLLFALYFFLLWFAGSGLCARGSAMRRGLVLACTALAALALVALGGGAFAATFPVIAAAVAGSVLPRRAAFAFAGAQCAGLVVAFVASGVAWPSALSYALIFGALQLFVVHTAQVARAEAAARRALELVQERLAESAADRERLRISRELHDVLGHRLTALSLTLEAASHLDGEARVGAILEAQVLTKRLLRDVRQVVSTTREAPVDLAVALRALAAETRGLEIHLLLPPVDLPTGAERALLRCVQEAVTNAARHGGAANLWVELASGPRGVRLAVRDDGRAPREIRPGHGLTGIRERMEELDGEASFRAAAGGGFEIVLSLPPAVEGGR